MYISPLYIYILGNNREITCVVKFYKVNNVEVDNYIII